MLLLDSPTSWPFVEHIIPGNVTFSGASYVATDTGQFLVAPEDVGLLLGYGFTVAGGQASRGPKYITDTAYNLLPTDDQPKMLVLSGTSATAVMVEAGVVSGGFTALIVDYVGGGSVAVGSGVTLLAPNGSATVSAGEEITIACPFDDVVVLGGSTT